MGDPWLHSDTSPWQCWFCSLLAGPTQSRDPLTPCHLQMETPNLSPLMTGSMETLCTGLTGSGPGDTILWLHEPSLGHSQRLRRLQIRRMKSLKPFDYCM